LNKNFDRIVFLKSFISNYSSNYATVHLECHIYKNYYMIWVSLVEFILWINNIFYYQGMVIIISNVEIDNQVNYKLFFIGYIYHWKCIYKREINYRMNILWCKIVGYLGKSFIHKDIIYIIKIWTVLMSYVTSLTWIFMSIFESIQCWLGLF
jgi:hypothetical protein